MHLAITAILSQAYLTIMSKLLVQHEISHLECNTLADLRQELRTNNECELVLVSRENLRAPDVSAVDSIMSLRELTDATIYVFSSNSNAAEITAMVKAGATDVIINKNIHQLEQTLKSFKIYRDTVSTVYPYQVLIVEDSKALSIMLQTHFEKKGMTVHSAVSAEQGIQILKTEYIDVIVCDLILEGDKTGMEVVRQTYQNSRWRGIPLLMTTAHHEPDRQRLFYKMGVRDVIAKPFDIEILLLKVVHLAKEHRLHELLISDRRKIEKMAFEDPETGLRNNAYLKANFVDWFKKQTGEPFAFLIEVDNYHKIKRQYGLDQSQASLKTVAQVLMESDIKNSLIVHLTGEQFVIMAALDDKDEAEDVAKDLINRVSSKTMLEAQSLSICIGVAESHEGVSLSGMLKIADGCLYLAQEDGEGQYVIT